MTWLWIILCVGITAFLLRGKNIAPHNFLWALIPIDRYGINLGGFNIKPVYIFCIIIIVYTLITKNVRLKIPRAVFVFSGFFVLMMVLSILLRGNTDIFSDVKVYGIMFFQFVLAAFTLSLITGSDDIRQIQDVLIATAVGYGLVFASLYLLDSYGISLGDVTANGMYDSSIFKLYRNATAGIHNDAIRLRGFYMEPNASNMCFIAGYAALLGDWIKHGRPIRNIFFAAIMLFNVILTSSRTALIIFIIITLFAIFRVFFAKIRSRSKIVFFGAILFVLFIGTVIIVYNSAGFSRFYDNFIARYQDRSALNDTFGRFTIWKESLAELFNGNWYSGIGVGKLAGLTETNRDAHNTIVEVMCSSGIFFGLYYTIFFISPFVVCLKYKLKDSKNSYNITTLLTIYLGMFILLCTISNIASVYITFFAFLFYIIPGCLTEENERISSTDDGLLNQNL